MEIYESYEYDQFKFINFNRSICKKNLTKLVSLNEEKNRFHLFPIVVDEEFNIIDGQHRFEACKKMDAPIYYVIDESNENHWQAITDVNQAGKKHSIGDVYEMLLRDNDDRCKKIRTVAALYPDITPGVLCNYFINNQRKGKTVLKLMQRREHKLHNFEYRFNLLEAFITTFGYFKVGHAQQILKLLTKIGTTVRQPSVEGYLTTLRSKGFLPVKGWATITFREELLRIHNKNKTKHKVTF